MTHVELSKEIGFEISAEMFQKILYSAKRKQDWIHKRENREDVLEASYFDQLIIEQAKVSLISGELLRICQIVGSVW